MAFKSEAQRRKFQEMVQQGTMSQETYDEWHANTKGVLPERVEKQPKRSTGPHIAWAQRATKAKKASKA